MRMEAADNALVRQFSVKRIKNGDSERVVDTVAAEEPLEIRVSYWFKDTRVTDNVAVMMRTPGADRELAAGFLLSEGIIQSREQIAGIRFLGREPSNEILIELCKDLDFESWRSARLHFVNSSCGVCGSRSREVVAQQVPAFCADDFSIDASIIARLPSLLGARQQGFAATGGLHAAALVNGSGEIEMVFEDIGRHNALDKLIGTCLLSGFIPQRNGLFFLSSRGSFELVQKTLMAGSPVLATVGGPSSLAIETAREHGLTLIGFVRDGRFNVYSGEWRVQSFRNS